MPGKEVNALMRTANLIGEPSTQGSRGSMEVANLLVFSRSEGGTEGGNQPPALLSAQGVGILSHPETIFAVQFAVL